MTITSMVAGARCHCVMIWRPDVHGMGRAFGPLDAAPMPDFAAPSSYDHA